MKVAAIALALIAAFLAGFLAPVPEMNAPETPPDLATPDLAEPARPKVCEANRATGTDADIIRH